MRLGQAVCDYVALVSDPEQRLCIVPLTEAEYRRLLERVSNMTAADNIAGLAVRDRAQSNEILVHAIREEHDLTQRVFSTVDEMLETLEVQDIDELIDTYSEMVDKSSPSLDAIPQNEMDNVKKALQALDWNALSGRSWYALKRFLGTIMPSPLLDNSVGSISTNLSIMTNGSEESTSIASPSSTPTDVKSAESQLS
jgi:hypothetical protein